jgi:acyl-CoA hydrolase
MRGFGSSLEQISNKLLSAEAAVEVVKPGHRVFVGTASASPFSLVEALERRKPTPPDVELFHFLTTGLAPLWVERQSAYRHRCFFVGSEARALVHKGQAEYVPISLTQIPYLMANGRIRADVALVQVSPPDTHGFVSLGISVAIAMSVLRYAKTIVAEVNPFMPRTLGDTFFMLIGLIVLSASRDHLLNMPISPSIRSPSASPVMSQRLLRMARRYKLISGVFQMRR